MHGRRWLMMLCLTLGGCIGTCTCPDVRLAPPAAGPYRAPPLAQAPGVPAAVLQGAESKVLDVDAAAHTVTIRYERGGKQVVEVWRMQ